MTYRGVLLDFYGTVVEEDGAAIRAIIARIAADQPGAREDALARSWGQLFFDLLADAHGVGFRTQREIELQSLATLLQSVGSQLDPHELSAPQFAYWQSPVVRPGAAEFLAACPVPVCVVSNIDRADLDVAVRSTQLPLPLTVTSEDVRAYKPQAALFEAGLGLLGLDRSEVLHVGDSLTSDVAGANALGVDVAWVADPSRHRPEHARIVHQSADLRDLLPMLSVV